MEITTIRLPETMKEAIEQEAQEQELSPTEYMRSILRNRKQITLEDSATESEAEYAELEDRLDELEERVTALEDHPEATQSDLLEYVRENGPVKAGELKEHCYPSDSEYARSTWWTKIAKDQLKESGAEYRNNQGWRMD